MKIRKAEIPSYLVVILIPLLFLFYSSGYSGPAYLSDEIGYLAKAAFLGGHVVNGSSSWHGGYSFFLAPVFAFFNSPSAVWSGAMVVNALLWFGSFFLLNQLLTIWFADISWGSRFFALLVSAIYPAWVTMSGYVFATSAIVFVFLCCVITLAKWRQTDVRSLLPHSICVGLLYWIHPTAMGVALASLVTVAVVSRFKRNYRCFVIHAALVILLIIIYKYGVHSWMNLAMTPVGSSVNEHYPSILMFLYKIGDFFHWVNITVKFLGQLSYVTISSFGLTLFGLIVCFTKGRLLFSIEEGDGDLAVSVVSLFLALSLVFVMCIGAAMFANSGAARADVWIYGRYVDGVVLPMLAIGFLTLRQSTAKMKSVVGLVAIVVIVGVGYSIAALVKPGVFNNLINTPAFWPQYLFVNASFSKWMLIGSLGVLMVAVFGEYAALSLMIVSFFLSSASQMAWHKNILSEYSRPSSIVDLVRYNYSPGNCVGFEPKFPPKTNLMQQERFRMYSYYFFDFGYRSMSQEQWLNGCEGPLLTYNPEQFAGSATERVLARENVSGLFVIVKDGKRLIDIPENAMLRGDVTFATYRDDPCLVAGCFAIKAAELARFSRVGVIRGDVLSSDGKAGYLFFGPYRTLKKGAYQLFLHGSFLATETAVIDVVSNQGKTVYYEGKLCNGKCLAGELLVPFELNENTTDLEIRLYVGNKDQVSISGYRIVE